MLKTTPETGFLNPAFGLIKYKTNLGYSPLFLKNKMLTQGLNVYDDTDVERNPLTPPEWRWHGVGVFTD